jgi:hypothetical protein
MLDIAYKLVALSLLIPALAYFVVIPFVYWAFDVVTNGIVNRAMRRQFAEFHGPGKCGCHVTRAAVRFSTRRGVGI